MLHWMQLGIEWEKEIKATAAEKGNKVNFNDCKILQKWGCIKLVYKIRLKISELEWENLISLIAFVMVNIS